MPVLTTHIRDTNAVAFETIVALGKIGPAAAPSVTALREALDHNLPEIRTVAIQSLGWIGPSAKPALPSLRRILTEQDHQLHVSTADALGLIGVNDAETVGALVERLADSQCRHSVVKALWRLDPERAKGLELKLVGTLEAVNPAWPPEPATQPFLADCSLLLELGPVVKDAFPDFA